MSSVAKEQTGDSREAFHCKHTHTNRHAASTVAAAASAAATAAAAALAAAVMVCFNSPHYKDNHPSQLQDTR